MKTIRCLAIDDEPIALDKLESYIRKMPFLELVARCESPLEASGILSEEQVDAIFVDVNMPDINGINFLEQFTNPPMVVFTTAYSEYAVHSYKLNAVDYLLKPYDFTDFSRAANKLLQRYDSEGASVSGAKEDSRHMLVKEGYKFVNVNVDNILYLKGLSEYVQVFMTNRQDPIIASTSLKMIKERLPGNFMQVHRSFIVNMNHIKEVERMRIIVEPDTVIPVGDNYKQAFADYLHSHAIDKNG